MVAVKNAPRENLFKSTGAGFKAIKFDRNPKEMSKGIECGRRGIERRRSQPAADYSVFLGDLGAASDDIPSVWKYCRSLSSGGTGGKEKRHELVGRPPTKT